MKVDVQNLLKLAGEVEAAYAVMMKSDQHSTTVAFNKAFDDLCVMLDKGTVVKALCEVVVKARAVADFKGYVKASDFGKACDAYDALTKALEPFEKD